MAIKIAQRHGRNFIAIRVFGSLGYSFFALTIGYVLRALGPSYSITVCLVIIAAALLITFGLKDAKRNDEATGSSVSSGEPLSRAADLKKFYCKRKCCGSSAVYSYSPSATE